MFNTILVAINGTQQCDKVLALAASLGHHALHIHLICVIATEFSAATADARDASPAAAREHSRASRIIEDGGRYLLREKIRCSTKIICGTPERSIVAHARDNECDLIIMGHHHLSTFERLVGNSVAYQVLENARCPVLIEVR